MVETEPGGEEKAPRDKQEFTAVSTVLSAIIQRSQKYSICFLCEKPHGTSLVYITFEVPLRLRGTKNDFKLQLIKFVY